jgi:hypothetical protein
VAAATLGAAFAVRARKRRRTAQAAPLRPSLPPRPVVARVSDPARSLVRMAVGAAVVVVLAIVTVVATKPSGGGRTVTPRLVMSPSGDPNGMYVQVAVPGPVGPEDRVQLTGDNGAQVEVGIRHDLDQPSYEQPGYRYVFYKVHIHNTGRVPVGARLATDAWVVDAGGTSYRADSERSEMVDQSEHRQLELGWEVDVEVGFPVPQATRLARVHIALPLGSGAPTAEWNLR